MTALPETMSIEIGVTVSAIGTATNHGSAGPQGTCQNLPPRDPSMPQSGLSASQPFIHVVLTSQQGCGRLTTPWSRSRRRRGGLGNRPRIQSTESDTGPDCLVTVPASAPSGAFGPPNAARSLVPGQRRSIDKRAADRRRAKRHGSARSERAQKGDHGKAANASGCAASSVLSLADSRRPALGEHGPGDESSLPQPTWRLRLWLRPWTRSFPSSRRWAGLLWRAFRAPEPRGPCRSPPIRGWPFGRSRRGAGSF